MPDTCFISGTSEKLMQIMVDGKSYFVSEDIADTCTAKQLNEKIRTKLAEDSNKNSSILAQLDDMAKNMGVSKSELIAILGGKIPGEDIVQQVVEPDEVIAPSKLTKVNINKVPASTDDGFRTVDGSLASPIRARVNIDSSAGTISGVVPGYSTVRDGNNKSVVESDKKVKTIKDGAGRVDTMIIKSNMGTTAIKVSSKNATEINKAISQTDQFGNLIRKSATGGNGQTTGAECSLCRGTGFTAINQQTCPKCEGVGYSH